MPKGRSTASWADSRATSAKNGRATAKAAWINLRWETPQKIDRVWLFDRPNTLDQVTAGVLEFSDGSSIKLEKPLSDTATKGLEISFKPKNVSWVKLTITGVKDGSPNIGLAEFGVFQSKR